MTSRRYNYKNRDEREPTTLNTFYLIVIKYQSKHLITCKLGVNEIIKHVMSLRYLGTEIFSNQVKDERTKTTGANRIYGAPQEVI